MAQIRHLQLSRRGDTRLAGCFGCHTGTHAALGTHRSDASLLAGASQSQRASKPATTRCLPWASTAT
jgi:hypothetical protein